MIKCVRFPIFLPLFSTPCRSGIRHPIFASVFSTLPPVPRHQYFTFSINILHGLSSACAFVTRVDAPVGIILRPLGLSSRYLATFTFVRSHVWTGLPSSAHLDPCCLVSSFVSLLSLPPLLRVPPITPSMRYRYHQNRRHRDGKYALVLLPH